jgi:hypothetical protein
MSNITYLIGAGASQQCLPIVAKMSKEIRKTISWLQEMAKANDDLSQSSDLKSIISELEQLAEICEPKRNFSIDTYAKTLRISGKTKEYNKLKSTLTLFFTLQQMRKFPDVRYGNFWASLVDEKDKLPSNVRILSWNYDFQLEITYQDFIKSESLRDTANALNLITYKTSDQKHNGIDNFTIFKINGSATYNSESIRDKASYIVDNLRSSDPIEAIVEILDYQTIHKNRIENHLSYAWEHDMSNKFFSYLLDCIGFTDILIIIGYSFPFFNRKIDKDILRSMHSLKKVYFQDPNANVIEERFLAIRDDISDRKLVTDTYQFILPDEL